MINNQFLQENIQNNLYAVNNNVGPNVSYGGPQGIAIGEPYPSGPNRFFPPSPPSFGGDGYDPVSFYPPVINENSGRQINIGSYNQVNSFDPLFNFMQGNHFNDFSQLFGNQGNFDDGSSMNDMGNQDYNNYDD